MTFSCGDRVVIKSVPSKYQLKYPNIEGAVGTIRSNYGASIAVKLDEYNNHASGNGYFYFGPGHLRLAIDEFLDITNSGGGDLVLHQANCFKFELDDSMRLYCAYDTKNETAILKTFAEMKNEMEENTMPTNLKYEVPMLPNFRVAGCIYPDSVNSYAFALYEDDIAVGDKVVVRNSGGVLQIVEIESIGEMSKDRVKNGCEVICKIDMAAYEARKAKAAQIHELKKEMDAKVAQLQAVALYELMAEKDPSLKTLLAEFKALTE